VINVERPGLSAYVTCGRDGTIRFWHKSTLAHMRSINHLDTIKASFNTVINESKGRDTDGKRPRNLKSAAVARAVNEMRKSWVCDIEQMALSNRLAVACMDRTIEFYDMHTGEPVCRISGLKYPPNCLECVQLGPDDQLVIIGDMGGYLHFWKMGKHFYIPDPNDVREAFDLRGRRTVQIHTDAVLKVKYIPDLNAAVTCSLDGLVSLVDLDKRKVLRSFTGHVGAVFDFDYCKKHRFMASVGMGREVVFWNPYTMDVLARGNGHGASVVHCIVDDDNGRIITVSLDKMVMCWDSGTCTCIQCFKEHRTHRPENSITAALWDSQRSALILAGSRISVWRNKGVIHVVQRSHEAPVAAALINERFHQVVSGDAMSNIHVWSIDSGQLVFRFGNAHGTSKISSMCFDASERRLVTGANDGTVFMWNFSNGKVLREYSSQSRNSTGDSREISGVAYCLIVENVHGYPQVLSEYLATSSWDRRVRIYAEDENRSDQSQCQIPSRVFPLDRDKNVGHTDDVLTIVHCGTQQVATGGFDGQVIMWATDGGKVKFKMCPADHDIEVIDAVSSIGGLTSVASLMKKRRKDGLLHDSENSVGSAGSSLIPMATLLESGTEDLDGWDGREYFAEARKKGGAANIFCHATDPLAKRSPRERWKEDDSSGTGARVESTPAEEESKTAVLEDDVAGQEPRPQGDANTEEVKDVKEAKESWMKDTCMRVEKARLWAPGQNRIDGTGKEENRTGAGTGKERGKSILGREVGADGPIPHKPPTALPSSKGRSVREGHIVKNHGSIGESSQADTDIQRERGATLSKGPSGKLATGNQSGMGTGRRGGKHSIPNTEPKMEKKEVFDNKACTQSIECLLFLKGYSMLVSGNGAGELHVWDTTSGALVFCTHAKHPDDAGLSAIGCERGDFTSVLLTGCSGGYVKTWRVGARGNNIVVLLYRQKKMLILLTDKDKRGKQYSAFLLLSISAKAHFDPGKARLSHLSAVRQWQAHETYVSSVQCIDYHGKVNLVVTAGADCNVHLWTLAGAYIGMFGQASGKWGIGSRATWRDPTAHSLLNSGKQDEDDDEDGTEGIDSDEGGNRSKKPHKAQPEGQGSTSDQSSCKHAVALSFTLFSRKKCPTCFSNSRANGAKDRQAREEEAEKKREECQRYQEKRYYEGSQNRVQKKLLRTRLNAFCMSQDHDKKERQKVCSSALPCSFMCCLKIKRCPPPHCPSPLPPFAVSCLLPHPKDYSQAVAFQLQLHKHQDVNAQAEKTLVRRKSRRRARGAQNAS
ncbi:unnamed protein product, partial [Discosporangium mesarthrocarpum]